jgi:thiamine pyrophosphokinase
LAFSLGSGNSIALGENIVMTADINETIWHPAEIFNPKQSQHRSHAIVILNQPLNLPFSVYQNLWSNSRYNIAADGGANRVYTLNESNASKEELPLTTVIGDLDSLLPEAHSYWRQKDVPIIHDEDQYSTDFMKAVNYMRGKPRERPGYRCSWGTGRKS